MAARDKRKEDLKEDVSPLLEELQEAEEGETFHKIFTREHSKATHKVLHYFKEDLHELLYREEDASACHLEKYEVDDSCMLVH